MTTTPALNSAADLVALVADVGSFEAWGEEVGPRDPLGFVDRWPYAERLAAAREQTGSTESVMTGRATLEGRPIAIVASEFAFIGGSIGTAAGERVARAFDRARDERLPLLAMPRSGGTRMQEGSLAVVQMAKLAAAARRLRTASLPYVVWCGEPTTGGVMASWASLGTVIFGMPGALLGFGGPRVVETLTGRAMPEGVQLAENLLAHGLIDDVVEPNALRERVVRVLAVALPGAANSAAGAPTRAHPAPPAKVDAWRSLGYARDPARPGVREFLAACAADVTVLRGDGDGAEDPACLAALARVRGISSVVIGQARDPETGKPGAMNAAGFRKVRRALGIAEDLGLPVVTLIDTPGAEMSAAAEESGLSRAIAHVLADMSTVRVPTLAVLLGEGGSGGALALLPADRVLCAEHGSLTPIAPEGASAILYRTTDRAPELAATQAISSVDLLRHGIVDAIVPEHPVASQERDAFLVRLGDAVKAELSALLATGADERLQARKARYRRIGEPIG